MLFHLIVEATQGRTINIISAILKLQKTKLMKYLYSILSIGFSAAILMKPAEAFSQKQIFGLTTYTPPKAWKKQTSATTVQFTKEDKVKGAYCIISLLKDVAGTADSKSNFDAAWETVVKEMVTVSAAPEMQAVATEDGWEIQSGNAAFENDGDKGIVILVTASGFGKMVNLIILTNTDVYGQSISDFIESISLKKPAAQQQTVQQPKKEPQKPAVANGYTFTTTNFDDGWTSTVQEDWVQVTKGTIRVLIHYPNKQADEYSADLAVRIRNGWNVLVAPKYSSMGIVEFKPVHNFESIELAEADAVENATGKPVHIVLFKKNYSGGRGKYLELIAPDKKSFVQEFGVYDGSDFNWEKVERMANYNKFAISMADLKGKWTSNFTGAIQYVNSFSGNYVGMNTHASTENYYLGPGNTYKWDLSAASGMVGNIKFQGVKSSGKFSMVGNWQIHFSDIEGKPKTFNAFFSCIKGFRLLWIDDTAFGKVE
jgi:hypothetical protein